MKDFQIATGKSCFDNKPVIKTVKSNFILEHFDKPRIIPFTRTEYESLSVDDRSAAKNHKYFIGGVTKTGSRTCLYRTFVALDVDFAPEGWSPESALRKAGLVGVEVYWHTTASHSPEKPKYRFLFPLDEKIEDHVLYQAICRSIMINMGLTKADATGFRFSQVMYLPQVLQGAPFIHGHTSGDYLNALDYLEMNCQEWVDSQTAPLFAGEDEAQAVTDGGAVQNPFDKRGVVGQFNRAFSVEDVLISWLPEKYSYCNTRSCGTSTWTRTGSSTSGGLHVYESDGLCYNHHQSNERLGTAHCFNAFDLCRLELFGAKDEARRKKGETWETSDASPSHKAFDKYLQNSDDDLPVIFREKRDEEVRAAFADDVMALSHKPEVHKPEVHKPEVHKPEAVRPSNDELVPDITMASILEDCDYNLSSPKPESTFILKKLKSVDERSEYVSKNLQMKGKACDIVPSAHNLKLLVHQVDSIHCGLRFDQLMGVAVHSKRSAKMGGDPTLEGKPTGDMLYRQIQAIISTKFQVEFSVAAIMGVVDEAAQLYRSFHPLRDRIESVEWDGIPRCATFLEDHYEIAPGQDRYMIAQTSTLLFLNAIRRVYYPGCDAHICAVLISEAEGTGKSSLGRILAGDPRYFSDCVDFSSTKTLMETCEGVWFAEMAEMVQANKKSAEHTKMVLSQSHLVGRPAYGRKVKTLPIQTVFYGTSNDKHCLKGEHGNRRLQVVEIVKLKDIVKTKNIVPQLMAEALFYAREPQLLPSQKLKNMNLEHQRQYCAIEPKMAAEAILEFIQVPFDEISSLSGDFDAPVLLEDEEGTPIVIRDCIPCREVREFTENHSTGGRRSGVYRQFRDAGFDQITVQLSRVATSVWRLEDADQLREAFRRSGWAEVDFVTELEVQVQAMVKHMAARLAKPENQGEVKDSAIFDAQSFSDFPRFHVAWHEAISIVEDQAGRTRKQKRSKGEKTQIWTAAE